MRRPELSWYRLRWPREMDSVSLQSMTRVLAAAGGAPVIVEAVGRRGSVAHRLGLPAPRAESVTEQLRHALPAVAVISLPARAVVGARRGVEIHLTSRLRPLQLERPELVASALLTALSHARRDETLVLQWQLLGSLPAASVATGLNRQEPLPASIGEVLLGRRGRLDSEALRALRAKRELPIWRAVGRIAVRAASPARERMLLLELVQALRLAEAPGVQVFARRGAAKAVDAIGCAWFARLRLNTAEVAAVAGWPVGVTTELPIECTTTRVLAPTSRIPRRGRIVAVADSRGAERPLALSVNDSLRHLHVVGPTGVGKSTLLLNLIVQDMAAGRSVVVIEPKGDLIADLLARIPADRFSDVVLLDPSDDERPVGLNPLTAAERPDVAADQLLRMFRSLYASSWGPRTNDILGASLLTLARSPGVTLCALPALLTDAGFRRRLVSGIDDPIGLLPFWQTFENWSAAERAAAIAPTLNRIRPFLLRPSIRAILGQVSPRLDLADVFRQPKILLVNLAKGVIGEEAAALLGSLVLAQLWSVAQRRTTIAPERRAPVFVYIDEFQDYLHLPTNLGEALTQARGLHVGFSLAHQHLGQLEPAIRAAVLANARSRICFQLGNDDARALATSPLVADDLRELGPFEVYAQLSAGGSVQRWCSGRTLPPPPPTSNPEQVRQRSRGRYGVDRAEVDAAIERLLTGRESAHDDLTPRRHKGGTA